MIVLDWGAHELRVGLGTDRQPRVHIEMAALDADDHLPPAWSDAEWEVRAISLRGKFAFNFINPTFDEFH